MNAQTFDILNSCSCYGHCNEKQYKNIEKLRNKVLSRSFDTKEWQKECRTVAEIDGIHYIENCSLWTENTIWLTLWMEKRPLIWIYEKENNKKINIEPLKDLIRNKVQTIIVVKNKWWNDKEKELLSGCSNIVEVENREEATKLSGKLCAKGGKVMYWKSGEMDDETKTKEKDWEELVREL